VIGHAKKGATFKLTGQSAGFYRVEADSTRPGFISQAAAKRSSETASALPSSQASFAQSWQVSPPRLELSPGPALVDGATYHLQGQARDEHKVADVYVFVSNRLAKIDRRKVFYRSNRGGATPVQMAFDANIPLWPGANVVTVVARESTQVQSQQTLIVERAGTKVAHAAAPSGTSTSPDFIPAEKTEKH
jgi:hypothetical protein